MARVKERLTGFSNGLVREAEIYDITNIDVADPDPVLRRTEINPGLRKREEIVIYPDSTTSEISTFGNGVLLKSRSAQNVTAELHYDSFGRLFKSRDRVGDHVTNYYAGTVLPSNVRERESGDASLADRETWGEAVRKMTYDGAGRLSLSQALAGISPTETFVDTRIEYNSRGQAVRQWGSGAMPLLNKYDLYGQRTEMFTFKDANDAYGWSGTSWPVPAGEEDSVGSKTTWTFDPATGLLSDKTDASGATLSFEYNKLGQLSRRILARGGGGAFTDYLYHPQTGALTDVNHTDPIGITPDLKFEYTRLGHIRSVTRGADQPQNRRHFRFRTSDFSLNHEELPSGIYGADRRVSRKYSTVSGGGFFLGKTLGTQYGSAANPGQFFDSAYTFEPGSGRLDTLSAHGRTFNYGYKPNSNLASTVSSGSFSSQKNWATDRNVLDSVDTSWSGSEKVGHAYQHDWLNRRTSVTRSGELFNRYGANLVTTYGYSSRSELTSADTVTVTGNPIPGRSFSYNFDNAGNRNETAPGGESVAYTPDANGLNQYAGRDVPRNFAVSGFAGSNATVVANNQVAQRMGGYFHALVAVEDNGPHLTPVEVAAGAPGAGAGGSDIIASDGSRQAYVAADPENFEYDADGNLTEDSLWHYTYDLENRLVRMTMKTLAEGRPTNMDRMHLEFTYDYLGRRVEKQVWEDVSEGDPPYGEPDTHLVFAYDGWTMIAELDGKAGLSVVRTYSWGLDISHSMQNAGGVGGLLSIQEGSSTYLTAYDGNGNLMGLLDSATGNLEAEYEYSPFGETIRLNGSAIADSNPFRFSTKYTDTETGLIYYGLRYYNPATGRFINQDPIGETGGANLYGFVGNDPVNNSDLFGLAPIPIPELEEFVVTEKRERSDSFFQGYYGGPLSEEHLRDTVTSLLFHLTFFMESGSAQTQDSDSADKEQSKKECEKLQREYDRLLKLHDPFENRVAAFEGRDPVDIGIAIENYISVGALTSGIGSSETFAGLMGIRITDVYSYTSPPGYPPPSRMGPEIKPSAAGRRLGLWGIGSGALGVATDAYAMTRNVQRGDYYAAGRNATSGAVGALVLRGAIRKAAGRGAASTVFTPFVGFWVGIGSLVTDAGLLGQKVQAHNRDLRGQESSYKRDLRGRDSAIRKLDRQVAKMIQVGCDVK